MAVADHLTMRPHNVARQIVRIVGMSLLVLGLCAEASGAQDSSLQPAAGKVDTVYDHRDAAVGMALSLVFPGGGQMYASRPEKGLALLALDVGGALVATSVLWLGSYVYSVAPAPGDARAYNKQMHPVARVWPIVNQHDRAEIGFALGVR